MVRSKNGSVSRESRGGSRDFGVVCAEEGNSDDSPDGVAAQRPDRKKHRQPKRNNKDRISLRTEKSKVRLHGADAARGHGFRAAAMTLAGKLRGAGGKQRPGGASTVVDGHGSSEDEELSEAYEESDDDDDAGDDDDEGSGDQKNNPLADVPFEQRQGARLQGVVKGKAPGRSAAAKALGDGSASLLTAGSSEGGIMNRGGERASREEHCRFGVGAGAEGVEGQKQAFKRHDKNAPMEMSSKRPVGTFREVIEAPRRPHADPRFAESKEGGEGAAFRRRYRWMFDEQLPLEEQQLKKALRKEKRPQKRQRLQAAITSLQQSLRQEQTARREAEVMAEWKRSELEAVRAGKKPYFLKKAEKKRLLLKAKFEELKKQGQLKKYMAARRKKNAAKDHRYLPSSRRLPDKD